MPPAPVLARVAPPRPLPIRNRRSPSHPLPALRGGARRSAAGARAQPRLSSPVLELRPRPRAQLVFLRRDDDAHESPRRRAHRDRGRARDPLSALPFLFFRQKLRHPRNCFDWLPDDFRSRKAGAVTTRVQLVVRINWRGALCRDQLNALSDATASQRTGPPRTCATHWQSVSDKALLLPQHAPGCPSSQVSRVGCSPAGP